MADLMVSARSIGYMTQTAILGAIALHCEGGGRRPSYGVAGPMAWVELRTDVVGGDHYGVIYLAGIPIISDDNVSGRAVEFHMRDAVLRIEAYG